MNKKRGILIGAGLLLLILVGGLIGAKAHRRAKFDKLTASVQPIDLAKLVSDDVVRIEVPTSNLVLEKQDETWETIPPSEVMLKQSEVVSITWSLSNMRAEKVIEEDPQDLSAYGLDEPKSRVIITTDDGAQVEYIAGNRSPSRTGYYAMMAGDPRVYLVPSYPGERLYLKLADIREKSLPSFEADEVRHFILESEKTRIEIEGKEEEDLWISSFTTHVMTSPYKIRRGVAPDRFSTLLTFFQDLRIRDFIDEDPADLAPYGLDTPHRVFVQTQDSSLNLLVGKAPAGSANRLYAKLDTGPTVFTIDDISPALAAEAFDLIDQFALIVGIDRIQGLEVWYEDRHFSGGVERQGEGDDIQERYFFNGREAEESAFKNFYQACIGLVTDAEAPAGTEPREAPEIRIRYRLDDPPGEEAELGLVPYNRDFYAASRDGVADLLVSRGQVKKILDTAEKMEYLD